MVLKKHGYLFIDKVLFEGLVVKIASENSCQRSRQVDTDVHLSFYSSSSKSPVSFLPSPSICWSLPFLVSLIPNGSGGSSPPTNYIISASNTHRHSLGIHQFEQTRETDTLTEDLHQSLPSSKFNLLVSSLAWNRTPVAAFFSPLPTSPVDPTDHSFLTSSTTNSFIPVTTMAGTPC